MSKYLLDKQYQGLSSNMGTLVPSLIMTNNYYLGVGNVWYF